MVVDEPPGSAQEEAAAPVNPEPQPQPHAEPVGQQPTIYHRPLLDFNDSGDEEEEDDDY